ncbi:alpha/beta hydrolase [Pseudomonas cichorii]|uniref:Alpha/beta hydrolase n=1 Tax=Pseudomonas lijiangensis TaxID=2995658 RepID=A0ABX8HM40_9PSED|nr:MULTISPECIES: alpha/beta hydrolase [Pseudomonas syringae group]MBX8499559.1 alpha/beta hydrolase [Pseudomonas lijiangensis]MBX8505321.1 alpha/beta hydrolase [Pseudomonas lijiangensis]MBX8519810.1 alpha/beta hydrolase [Pseudomonas cichorii]MBX8540730.1 alpha/beta hydrolase [Pseudomonas cichorii]MBX8543835.1 alpha/beta hydrolase [Pseudomonas cichorii]
MPIFSLARIKARRFTWACMAALIIGLPVGCAVLEHKERELVFRIEPGNASWYSGLPADVQELELNTPSFGTSQNIHAWWWPATRKDAPAILYLHGSRWNLTGQLFRIEQLRALGFSILAIDYRGFGQSMGQLPSEDTVYEDARIAWDRLKQLQPDPQRRLIYGHSLGGAVAVDLAAELGRDARKDDTPTQARGLIIESTFTNLADVAAAIANTSLPVRWLLSQKFDSLDKIADIHMPVLIVHGTDDRYVPARFSEELFEAAQEPKNLLLVPGGTHNNSMRLGRQAYSQAIQTLLKATASPEQAKKEENRQKQAG